MDAAENTGSSAEVTVFVQNRDMTLAAPDALEQQVAPPAPEPVVAPVAPPVGTVPDAPATLTERQFNEQHEEPTLIAAVPDMEALRSEVGYVSAIRDDGAAVRTSLPRQLAALPKAEEPVQTADEALAIDHSLIGHVAITGVEGAAQESQIAAIDASPRMTMPRHLPEVGRHLITPIADTTGLTRPIEPRLASAESIQRITRPRTEVAALPSTEAMVLMQPGRLVLEPAMELRPGRTGYEMARTTAPLRSLLPTETLAADLATLDTLVIDAEPIAADGTIVAFLEARTTMPTRDMAAPEAAAETAPELGVGPTTLADRPAGTPLAAIGEPAYPGVRTTIPSSEVPSLARAEDRAHGGIAELTCDPEVLAALPETSQRLTTPPGTLETTALLADAPARDDRPSGLRIAVLPEQAARMAIPDDGRITRPGEPIIAPVASSAFEDIEVVLNSKTLDLLVQPELREGISLAPLREIFEASDGVVYWYPVEKRVRATRPGTEMDLTIGNPEVTVNDNLRTLQVAPYIKHGRTMVPLQFIADTLDVTITFNPKTGQICLTSNEF